ncbi:hypothetical protein EPA93_24910 [Ktedonosporobacter rubrisoli]|uniref:Uncharacterized protein n=1 Tax=Ktedonosporobacter rubrisoli TaxID=2509675 RepID=A0A4P6JTX1_KTERU|nr:hypothetical protein [Ktedonosporobacter rubrisoli]QBD79049.1 hypothetical protein EPA93_24910 [Ktedonosporobacter rubrisoli]
MEENEARPSFQDVRRKHTISYGMLLEELHAMGMLERLEIRYETLELLDKLGFARLEVLDAALEALSRLAGKSYSRESIDEIGLLPSVRRARYPKLIRLPRDRQPLEPE